MNVMNNFFCINIKKNVGVLGYIIILLFNIICMLFVTLIIASLTLIERKALSLVQRRVGPFFVGYRGRLQYLADALKLFKRCNCAWWI